MRKTPVSILQEMMVQKGKVPNYQLIYDGGGSHENTFTYKVSCEGLEASGTGRCKKDAKHTAAKSMLQAIAKHNALPALPASPAKSPVRTPLPEPMPTPHSSLFDEPFVNAIGKLKDLCAENELAEPTYVTINDVGPPHARIFTIQCIVSSFKEEGKATTKKQAKHEAARKMCNRIQDLVENSSPLLLLQAQENEDFVGQDGNIFLYLEKFIRKKDNLGVKLSNYHLKLIENFDIDLRETILKDLHDFKKYINDTDLSTFPDPLNELSEQLKQILSPINVDIAKFVTTCYDDTNSAETELSDPNLLIMISLNTTPEITHLHSGPRLENVVHDLFLHVIKSLEYLLH